MPRSAPSRNARTALPGHRTLPPVRADLPGGTIEGHLVRRWQTDAGEWIYVVAVRAWSSRAASTGADVAEDMIEIPIPVRQVRPVRGVIYDGVPTLHRRPPPAPGSAPAPPQAVSSPAPTVPALPAAGEWTFEERRPHAHSQAPSRILIHHFDCWIRPSGPSPALSTNQARQMIAKDPRTEPCDVCEAPALFPTSTAEHPSTPSEPAGSAGSGPVRRPDSTPGVLE